MTRKGKGGPTKKNEEKTPAENPGNPSGQELRGPM